MKCSCLEQSILESEKALLDYQMRKMDVMDKLEEMEDSPNTFSESSVSRKRNAAALLERSILSESAKLDKFRDQLETVHAEECTTEEEEGSTGEELVSSADEEEEHAED